MKAKRGISPLIATVLLIGFTVALAAVIMTWGLDYIKGTTDTVGKQTNKFLLCTNMLKIAVKPDCASNKVTIENNGEINIESVRIAVQRPQAEAVTGEGIPTLLSQEYEIDLTGGTAIKVQPTVMDKDNQTAITCDVLEYPLRC